jgi:nucleotide-binding universal stress UspA family protein
MAIKINLRPTIGSPFPERHIDWFVKMPQELIGKRRAAPRAGLRSGGVKINHILVPIDFSPASRKVLEFASQYAGKFGALITVINVIEPSPETDPDALPAVLARGRDLQETQQALESFAEQSVAANLLKNTKVYAGRAYEQIVGAAKKLKVDLIIISAHGYIGAGTDIVGSTTERVVRFAHCPVLTIRPESVAK